MFFTAIKQVAYHEARHHDDSAERGKYASYLGGQYDILQVVAHREGRGMATIL